MPRLEKKATHYTDASAPRPDEKSLAVPPCLVWRKNPRITQVPLRLVLTKNLSLSRDALSGEKIRDCQKNLSLRASARREASALGVHTGVAIRS